MTRPLSWICAGMFWALGALMVAQQKPVSWEVGAALSCLLGVMWFFDARRGS